MEIKDLGFDDWFENLRKQGDRNLFAPARITVVYRDSYLVRDETGEYPAEAAGRFLYAAESELDMPAVGDWVGVDYFNDHTEAVIQDLYPRRTVLKRKTSGQQTEFQLIAANIDTALIMQSCGADFNLRRMERYLVAVRDGGIEPVILLSKNDLVSNEELSSLVQSVREVEPETEILSFSNLNGAGLEDIRRIIESGKTYCLIGSSGVGKTTLLNALIGDDIFFTKDIRQKDEKGRHATSRRQLVLLEDGGMIIDTPGMRELGIMDAESGLQASFTDIEELAKECRYKDCTHTREGGCAVKEAVEEGRLEHGRYKSYMKLRRESAFNEMSYLERRRKDKSFGRMVKDVTSHRKKERGDY